jgi:hypothetical protein
MDSFEYENKCQSQYNVLHENVITYAVTVRRSVVYVILL